MLIYFLNSIFLYCMIGNIFHTCRVQMKAN
uniref:Uncharacterized protein n=1 Tax=Arundo donax TaxID=35708 RepID=A0A0A8YGH7_ARUDO